jgi:hypothetical protein
MRGAALARMIGSKKINPYQITIAKAKGTVLCPDGVRRNGITDPYMPEDLEAEFHPGGNSLCYTIQTAHLMGSKDILCMGFTLKSGGRYFFGTEKNPITKRASIYDTHRALGWLSWYESQWPGRARLMEGWGGPVYDVLQQVTHEELREQFGGPKPEQEWIV